MSVLPRPRTLHGSAGVDLVATCRPMTDGASDPTWQLGRDHVTRALRTPDGPATLRLELRSHGATARAWGPGADWILDRADRMLGTPIPPTLLEAPHPVVRRRARESAGARFGASLVLGDAVTPAVLGQRVTSREARSSWWQLVRRHGSPAPGCADVLVPPSPSTLAGLPLHEWHRLGVERGRAEAVRRCLVALPALDAAAERSSGRFQRAACELRGIGPWTATLLAATVHGDTDAVLLGDLHLPHTISHVLAGEPRGTDERMLELLEPWRGERARVARLLKGAGRAPRRGPRYTPLPIARW